MPADSTVQDLNNLYRQARTARARLEPDWYTNLAFYDGYQWLAWDGHRLYQPRMPKNRMTLTDNRIRPIIRKEIARMTKQRPVFTVTPNSADREDSNAADLGEQVMRYLWKHLKLSPLRRKALLWSRITGAGFLKCYWDSSIGPKRNVVLGPDGKLLMGPSGPVQPNSPEHMMAEGIQPGGTRTKTVAQGDIKVEVRSPFQMFPDPLADTFDELEWLIEESVKSPEYIRRRYGVEARADTPANPGLVEARMGGVANITGGGYMGVRVREYWCKPNPTHPQGVRAVWLVTGADRSQTSQMLEEDSKPFDPMPYVMLSGIPVPGRLMPRAIVDDLKGPQVELNKVESQLAENRNRVGNPSLLMSRQATQDPQRTAADWANPGGIIFFDDLGSPNAKPGILEAPNMPEYVVEQIPQIIQSMEAISGQHEVSNAQVPPGVTAASAINLLQEADDMMISPDMEDHEEELGKLGQKLLKLVGNFYEDPRTIQIGGDNGAWQIMDFKGAMLKGNTHVDVQAGSAFPQGKAAKQAWIQDMMRFFVQSGQQLDPRQLAQILQDMDVGGMERMIADYTVTETQANRENVLLAQGIPLPINPQDDDQGHVANHQDFERQPRFFQLPPQIQQIHLAHTKLHTDKIEQQQQQQLQQQLMLEGKVNPMMSPSALQDEHELSQMQGLQEALGSAQQQQSQQEQAGMQMAQGEQQQRHAEATHQTQQATAQQQAMMALQKHHQEKEHAEELHQAKLQQIRSQANRPQGAPNGR